MIMTVHAMLLILLGARVPVPGGIHFNDVLYALLSGLLSGILVALIEESFFRGAMHYGMRRHSPMLTATITTALLYATVHFITCACTSGGHNYWLAKRLGNAGRYVPQL